MHPKTGLVRNDDLHAQGAVPRTGTLCCEILLTFALLHSSGCLHNVHSSGDLHNRFDSARLPRPRPRRMAHSRKTVRNLRSRGPRMERHHSSHRRIQRIARSTPQPT
jgi:hypothetical protein